MFMLHIAVFVLLLVFAPGRVFADPLSFGQSWDGNPPGTLEDITGFDDFGTTGLFGAGTYDLTIDGGFSAWSLDHELSITSTTGQSQVFNARGENSSQSRRLTFHMVDDFGLVASTPDLDRAGIFSGQWAFRRLNAHTWLWGLEDITYGEGDNDFQDVYGTLTWRGYEVSPIPTPEPGTLSLLALGASGFGISRYLKKRKERE